MAIRKSIILLLILSFFAVSLCTNSEAVEQLLDDVSDPKYHYERAGVTEQDVIDAHTETHDEIELSDIYTELLDLKERISLFTENPEQLTQAQKDLLVKRAEHLEKLSVSHEGWHEELNHIMEDLAGLNIDGQKEDL